MFSPSQRVDLKSRLPSVIATMVNQNTFFYLSFLLLHAYLLDDATVKSPCMLPCDMSPGNTTIKLPIDSHGTIIWGLYYEVTMTAAFHEYARDIKTKLLVTCHKEMVLVTSQ